MKKLWLMVFLGFSGLWAFGEVKEIDFLLFKPNSGNQFENEEQAVIHLDNAAEYLTSRNPGPGQIYVYGYAADFANDVDPVSLSRERALFVISELQKRGLSENSFANPVGYGPVDLWGVNSVEKERGLNRRVRILLNETVLAHVPVVVPAPVAVRAAEYWTKPEEPRPKYPWWIFMLALLAVTAAVLFFALKGGKRPSGETALQEATDAEAVAGAKSLKIKILEEEEISLYAYGLYEKRNFQKGKDEEDWLRAVCELTAYYEARGYQVLPYWETR